MLLECRAFWASSRIRSLSFAETEMACETTSHQSPLPHWKAWSALYSTLRVLTVVDTFSRFAPALEPRFSFRGADVVEVLERVGPTVGLTAAIRVDQGTEFVSRDLDLWAYQRGVTLDFSRPGRPTDNAFIEAFNGRFRAERLNAHWFLSLADAREKMEDWRKYYNEERPMGRSAKNRQNTLLNHVGATSPPS